MKKTGFETVRKKCQKSCVVVGLPLPNTSWLYHRRVGDYGFDEDEALFSWLFSFSFVMYLCSASGVACLENKKKI
jgi:hypothetical protein